MKVNVWYELRNNCHCFASLYDECNYCYPVEQYSFEEARERYEADHEFEGFEYHYLNTPEA